MLWVVLEHNQTGWPNTTGNQTVTCRKDFLFFDFAYESYKDSRGLCDPSSPQKKRNPRIFSVRVKSGAAIFGTPNRQPPPGNAIYERIPEM